MIFRAFPAMLWAFGLQSVGVLMNQLLLRCDVLAFSRSGSGIRVANGDLGLFRDSATQPNDRMIFDPFEQFTPPDFLFRIARTQEQLTGYWQLRSAIFCEEQHIFRGSDRDKIDEHAIPIVCETLIAGMEDSVVGVVRIDEREPGVWFGSRLGVAAGFRSLKRLSPGVALRNHQPVYRGLGTLGAGLIYKAVSTAHALGCREFLATVQHQNEKFFRRLHWESLDRLELFGLTHVRMRADLDYYRPAECVF
jgi:hypothetical protein